MVACFVKTFCLEIKLEGYFFFPQCQSLAHLACLAEKCLLMLYSLKHHNTPLAYQTFSAAPAETTGDSIFSAVWRAGQHANFSRCVRHTFKIFFLHHGDRFSWFLNFYFAPLMRLISILKGQLSNHLGLLLALLLDVIEHPLQLGTLLVHLLQTFLGSLLLWF